MPDRYGDEPFNDDPTSGGIEPPPQTAPDREWAAEQRAIAIAHCGLCDDDGVAKGFPCDHVDRSETTQRGRALVQAELDAIRRRKADRVRGVQ